MRRFNIGLCDHCGAVALEHTYYFYGDVFRDAPEGWTKLGKEDLCPVCSEIYQKFKAEVIKEKENAEN